MKLEISSTELDIRVHMYTCTYSITQYTCLHICRSILAIFTHILLMDLKYMDHLNTNTHTHTDTHTHTLAVCPSMCSSLTCVETQAYRARADTVSSG